MTSVLPAWLPVRRRTIATAVFVVLPVTCWGQADLFGHSETPLCDLQAHIGNVKPGQSLTAELTPIMGPGYPVLPAVMKPNGDIDFGSVPAGEYQLRITDSSGGLVRQELISVSQEHEFLSILLPDRRRSRPVSGTVSVRELQRTIPGNALKEKRKAEKAIQKGNLQQAADHLRRAIDIYPDYTVAHNDLGVCYTRMKQLDKALEELQKAHHLDPAAPLVNANLAAVFFTFQRYSDAEEAARLALRSDPGSERARLVLGLSLTAQNRDQQEAVENLKRAAEKYPRARLAVAQILEQSGHWDQAADELKHYLRSPAAAENRQDVELWLQRLQP